MQIRFYANFRTLTDQAILDLSGSDIKTLRQLFDYLISLYPEILPQLLDAHGNLRPDVPLFVNGRNPRLTNVGLDFTLNPGDEISLFSPISSGRMNVEVMRPAATNVKE